MPDVEKVAKSFHLVSQQYIKHIVDDCINVTDKGNGTVTKSNVEFLQTIASDENTWENLTDEAKEPILKSASQLLSMLVNYG